MAEAYIIDAVRTPRSIGKMGKGALSAMHPEHLSASVLAAIRDRNNLNTAEVDDVIWGVSGAMGLQGGDIGRNAALDAGYDPKAGGVTLNRFCGSSITATNFAAGMIMSGMHDLAISGGMDMMSYVGYYGGEMYKAGLSKGNGMGIGLSICRTLVEAHGGRLWHEARPGGGALFQFSLPRARGEA